MSIVDDLNKENKKEERSRYLDIERPANLVFIFLLVILIWSIGSYFVYKNYLTDHQRDSGKLGDSYGIISSFFSALGLAGIIVTFLLQRKDLNRQQKEAQIQRFENTFFNLLNLHLNHIQNIKLGDAVGRDIFDRFLNTLYFSTNHFDGSESAFFNYVYRFSDHYDVCKSTLSRYTQSIKIVFDKVVFSHFLTESERFYYYDILASQISYSERRFLYYYSILYNKETTGDPMVIRLVMHLALFTNLKEKDLLNETHDKLREFLYKKRIGKRDEPSSIMDFEV